MYCIANCTTAELHSVVCGRDRRHAIETKEIFLFGNVSLSIDNEICYEKLMQMYVYTKCLQRACYLQQLVLAV